MAMAVMSKQDPSPAFIETIQEIMRLYKSLPPRPSIEEVEAAKTVLQTAENEEKTKLEAISKDQQPLEGVPDELLSILQQVRKTMVLFRSHEQKKEALYLVEVDDMFEIFDGLIQRASLLVSGDNLEEKLWGFDGETVISDDSLVTSSSTEASCFSGKFFIFYFCKFCLMWKLVLLIHGRVGGDDGQFTLLMKEVVGAVKEG